MRTHKQGMRCMMLGVRPASFSESQMNFGISFHNRLCVTGISSLKYVDSNTYISILHIFTLSACTLFGWYTVLCLCFLNLLTSVTWDF